MSSRRAALSQRERGQVIVLFALLLPVFLALGGFVIGIGNWYTHGKHLQTKADAGAFAGGGSWSFPCELAVDQRIDTEARAYAGPQNPQVGKVANTSIHTVLNGSTYYDDDSNPAPLEYNSPPSNWLTTPGALCNAKILDVKVTEDDSFPLASLIPLFPDIKRHARVEIREAVSITEDLLPIAVRAPEPVSMAAVYYNESSGTILDVKYMVKTTTIGGLPPPLQGWTQFNSDDPTPWASFIPGPKTGVTFAVSFRGACNTGLPVPNNNITTSSAPCFEDNFVGQPVGNLCNQGNVTQIVNCYWGTGTWPTETVQAGLQFIRGYQNFNPNSGGPPFGDAPAIESAFLTSASCTVQGVSSPAYYNAHPINSCNAQLNVEVDVGGLIGEYGPAGPAGNGPLHDEDIQVRYRLVRDDGTSSCNYGTNCSLNGNNGQGPTLTYNTTGGPTEPHLPLTANSRMNAVAIEIQIKNVPGHANGNCRDPNNFSNNCRWYYTGNPGPFGTSVAPTNAQILAAPIQRAFRANTVTGSSFQWMRLTTDPDCAGAALPIVDLQAASQRSDTGSPQCYAMEVGRKGGVATDQDNQPILFNDGIGPSQMGALDCDPNVPQGQALLDSVMNGCPEYGVHPFDWTPLCPQQNQIFTGFPTGNPGPPWDDGRWPPMRCVKTRTTGSMNQLERGLDNRFFGQNNAPCPTDSATGPVRGRNYWDNDNNAFDGVTYKNDVPPSPNNIGLNWDDPRLVTIFLVPTETFSGSGQNTYPITGFIDVYITGYGRVSGSGSIQVDDPCPGSDPPSDLDTSGGFSGGYAVWGHIINHVHRGGGGSPGPNLCNPGQSTMPCVATLVE